MKLPIFNTLYVASILGVTLHSTTSLAVAVPSGIQMHFPYDGDAQRFFEAIDNNDLYFIRKVLESDDVYFIKRSLACVSESSLKGMVSIDFPPETRPQDDDGGLLFSSLTHAIFSRRPEVLELLLNFISTCPNFLFDDSAMDIRGPAMAAASFGATQELGMILDFVEKHPSQLNNMGCVLLLEMAIDNGKIETFRFLLNYVEQKPEFAQCILKTSGETHVSNAIDRKQEEMFRELLEFAKKNRLRHPEFLTALINDDCINTALGAGTQKGKDEAQINTFGELLAFIDAKPVFGPLLFAAEHDFEQFLAADELTSLLDLMERHRDLRSRIFPLELHLDNSDLGQALKDVKTLFNFAAEHPEIANPIVYPFRREIMDFLDNFMDPDIATHRNALDLFIERVTANRSSSLFNCAFGELMAHILRTSRAGLTVKEFVASDRTQFLQALESQEQPLLNAWPAIPEATSLFAEGPRQYISRLYAIHQLLLSVRLPRELPMPELHAAEPAQKKGRHDDNEDTQTLHGIAMREALLNPQGNAQDAAQWANEVVEFNIPTDNTDDALTDDGEPMPMDLVFSEPRFTSFW